MTAFPPSTKYELVIEVAEYIAAAMTKDTARWIDIETIRRAHLRYGQEHALRKALETTGATAEEYARLQGQERVYRDAAGEIVVPSRQIRGCLREAAQGLYRGKEAERVQRFIAKLQITPDDILTGRREPDDSFARPVDRRSSGRLGEVKHRWTFDEHPRFYKLELRSELQVPPNSVSEEQLAELLAYAGSFVGIGTARAIGKGGFRVLEFRRIR